jgi:outer membrane protein OmpU
MRKSLLATTTLAGAILLGAALAPSTSALAAAPTVADNLKLTIEGELRFSIFVTNQDLVGVAGPADPSDGFQFRGNDEAEIRFNASATAANGLQYGFTIEVQTQTNDTLNADEGWMFVNSNTWGRVELGDQDDAPDRMFVGGEDVMKGRGGFDGAVDEGFRVTGILGIDPDPAITLTDDASKIIYFTPRFSGFQLGFSFTPDTGMNGGQTANDNNGDFSNVFGFGANYAREVMGVAMILSAVASLGDNDTDGNAGMSIWGAGATFAYQGFEFGVGYADHGDTGVTLAAAALGADGGQWWDVGIAYTTGPFAISAGFFQGWASNVAGTPDSETQIFSIAGAYNVAPGWDLRADINFIDVTAIGRAAGANNDGHLFVLSSVMTF